VADTLLLVDDDPDVLRSVGAFLERSGWTVFREDTGEAAITAFQRERPDVVVTTGAGVALPFFVLARLMGIPTVYVEVYDRLDTRTLTARLCRPFTSRMLVQFEEQTRLYKGATLVGPLL